MKKNAILIVEDELPLLEALREKFVHEGYSVYVAKNGQEGLDLAFSEKPDVILLDVIMPVMDGMTMLKRLRSTNEWGAQVPVIILTNLTGSDDAQIKDIQLTEPSYYLIKADLSLDQVVEKVRERLA